ncbi:MAG: ATP-binding cassette domain-containing protein [Leptospiraceae bacterium]|nr:ATP-binding cassette domain-containing protein [Leptospiraceae bacterium]MCP5497878.1 ATP-binding cassette domain-containing protein [Leptospiraceae bacterium]
MVFSETVVPYPWKVVKELILQLSDRSIYYHISITIIRTIFGFILAFVIGFAIGIITGSYKSIEKSFFLPVVILQGAPPIIWIIPLMLILGTEGWSPVAVVYLVTLPLVIINVQEGMKSIPDTMWDMFKIYANDKKLTLRYLVFPSLIPYIKSILLLGSVLAFKSSIIGEWFGAKNGIGRIINEYFYTFNMLSFYSASLLFLLLVGTVAFGIKTIVKYTKTKKNSVITYNTHFHKKEFFHPPKNTHIKIEELCFRYKKRNILDHLNFEIKSFETIVITGDSGCGKTTLAKLITGLLKPSSGSITKSQNPCIIFQEDTLIPTMDCFANTILPGKWKKTPELDHIGIFFLDKCGLKKYVNYFPDQLSGGMKKRLTLARALVLNPDFIILDEPFTNLDHTSRHELWQLFFELFANRGIPSIIITHYPEELANRDIQYYELKHGKLWK